VTLTMTAPGGVTSRILSGQADASAAVDVGDGYMLLVDDEDNSIRVYRRGTSGGRSRGVGTGRRHWTGSMSNDKNFKGAPARSTVFTRKVSGSGLGTELRFGDVYKGLRAELLAWDHNNGDRLGLTATAAPGSTSTAYLGFRAPIIGGKALIVPVTNADK